MYYRENVIRYETLKDSAYKFKREKNNGLFYHVYKSHYSTLEVVYYLINLGYSQVVRQPFLVRSIKSSNPFIPK